jgi:GH25 family lysozyme M1 (1,4-beta-N-acetylmuramidase)
VTVKGIDVASYQPIDYDTTGLAFVFVKRTEGTGYVNPRASAQVAHGRAAGLVIGHYHYPHIHDGAAADADYFLTHLGADLHAGDLIALDWEWYGEAGVSAAEADAFKDQWLARVKAKLPGHRVGAYSDVSNWTHTDVNSNCGDFLWIATGGRPPGSPGIQHPWTFHQYSTAGGIDHDVANFATAAALKAWANPAPPKPPAPKYEPYPGAAFFKAGRKSPIIAAMHKRLIEVGCDRYKSSRNADVWGSGDVASYAAWQRKCHYSGADANGIPGPTTWALLRVPNV